MRRVALIRNDLGGIGSLPGVRGHGNIASEAWPITYLFTISIAYPLLYISQVKAQDHGENWGELMMWGIQVITFIPLSPLNNTVLTPHPTT